MFISRLTLLSFLVTSAPTATLVHADTSVAFSYDPLSDVGPANWGLLPLDGNQCDGEKNSPIAVATSACTLYANYHFDNGSCRTNDLKYELTTTGVKASYQNENDVCEYPSVIIPGVPGRYKALQFHIHTSSEHTIDGKFFGAELHTVHINEAGDHYAVVGMMIEPTASQPNSLVEQLLEGFKVEYDSAEAACVNSTAPVTRNLGVDKDMDMNKRKLVHTDAPQLFAPYLLIPDGATFYHYDGGLTTPPCSEVVWWNLADKPVQITPGQYHRLAEYVLGFADSDCNLGTHAGPAGSTSRPTVPLNGRVVDRICPVGFTPKNCLE